MKPNDLLDGHVVAAAIFERICTRLDGLGSLELRTTKSQIALWSRHGFAYFWLPGQYLKHASVPAVLSIVLGRKAESKRFKEVVHPSSRHWIHHLELHTADDIDDEVVAWLAEAFRHASQLPPGH